MIDYLERGIHGHYPFQFSLSRRRTHPSKLSYFAEDNSDSFLNEDFYNLEIMNNLAHQFAEEGIDEALPRLTRIAARYLTRPLQRRRLLSRSTQHQIQRSTNQAAQTIISRQGRLGIRDFPRLTQNIRQRVARQNLSPISLSRTIQTVSERTSQSPVRAQTQLALGSSRPIESSGATPSRSPYSRRPAGVAETASVPEAIRTSIRPGIAESQAYNVVLSRGEIGIERPIGANVSRRADFITAARGSDGRMRVILTDVSSTSVPGGGFKSSPGNIKPDWIKQLNRAINRLSIPGNTQLEQEIRQASYRPVLRQINVDYSPRGQGLITDAGTGQVLRDPLWVR